MKVLIADFFSDVNFIPPTWEEFEENQKLEPAQPKKTKAQPVPDNGAGRGRGDQRGRGRPGRGNGAGRGGKAQQPADTSREVQGKVPQNYKLCKDRNGRDVCIKYQSGGCQDGVDGMCGKGSRMRMHVCATITNVSNMTLCLATDHAHKDCPSKV